MEKYDISWCCQQQGNYLLIVDIFLAILKEKLTNIFCHQKEAKKQAAKQLLERFKAGNNTDNGISQSDTANSVTHNNDDGNDRDHDTEQVACDFVWEQLHVHVHQGA